MAFPPIEPFAIPATCTVPVFASELTGSRVARYVPCTRARTMIDTLRQQVRQRARTRRPSVERAHSPEF